MSAPLLENSVVRYSIVEYRYQNILPKQIGIKPNYKLCVVKGNSLSSTHTAHVIRGVLIGTGDFAPVEGNVTRVAAIVVVGRH